MRSERQGPRGEVSSREKGLGLGRSLVQEISWPHGGEMQVFSDHAQTRFIRHDVLSQLGLATGYAEHFVDSDIGDCRIPFAQGEPQEMINATRTIL